MSNKKNVAHICKNCLLYDGKKGECKVTVLLTPKMAESLDLKEERIHLPVLPNDPCFFETEIFEKDKEKFIPADNIEQVKWWVEDPITGEKSNKGKVKIEYPEGFFGKNIDI